MLGTNYLSQNNTTFRTASASLANPCLGLNAPVDLSSLALRLQPLANPAVSSYTNNAPLFNTARPLNPLLNTMTTSTPSLPNHFVFVGNVIGGQLEGQLYIDLCGPKLVSAQGTFLLTGNPSLAPNQTIFVGNLVGSAIEGQVFIDASGVKLLTAQGAIPLATTQSNCCRIGV